MSIIKSVLWYSGFQSSLVCDHCFIALLLCWSYVRPIVISFLFFVPSCWIFIHFLSFHNFFVWRKVSISNRQTSVANVIFRTSDHSLLIFVQLFHCVGLGFVGRKDTHGLNSKRLAEVWMDEYKRLFYLHRQDIVVRLILLCIHVVLKFDFL